MAKKSRADFDNPWKEMLDHYFELFLAFFFPQAHSGIDWSRGFEFLDKELRKILRRGQLGKREADKLVKVWLHGGQELWLLIHIEVQNQKEADFTHRMFVYNYRAHDRYNCRVVSLALLTDDDPQWRPDHFGWDLWGCTMGLKYPIVKLLDYSLNWPALEANPNPFATVVMAHLKARETQEDTEHRHTWKLRLVKGLYERGLKADDVRQLFRFIDWVMVLPDELEIAFWQEIETIEEEKRMPFITSVERLGMQKGLEQGLQQGLQQGLLQGIQSLLKTKFPKAVRTWMPKVRKVEGVETLKAILAALEKAQSPEVLQEWIS